MRRKITTVRGKSGAHNGNGAGNPRAVFEEALYRNHLFFVFTGNRGQMQRDPRFSGWANPSRPRDYAIFLPKPHPSGS